MHYIPFRHISMFTISPRRDVFRHGQARKKKGEPTPVDMYRIVNTVVASHLSSDHMVLPEFANVARRWEGRKIGGAPLPEEHTRAGSTPLRQQDAGAEEPSEAAAAAPQIKRRRTGKGPDGESCTRRL